LKVPILGSLRITGVDGFSGGSAAILATVRTKRRSSSSTARSWKTSDFSSKIRRIRYYFSIVQFWVQDRQVRKSSLVRKRHRINEKWILELHFRDQEVGGSNPLAPTTSQSNNLQVVETQTTSW
jgi:hypothetical protein